MPGSNFDIVALPARGFANDRAEPRILELVDGSDDNQRSRGARPTTASSRRSLRPSSGVFRLADLQAAGGRLWCSRERSAESPEVLGCRLKNRRSRRMGCGIGRWWRWCAALLVVVVVVRGAGFSCSAAALRWALAAAA